MARTLTEYFERFEAASLPPAGRELEWSTNDKREVLTSIRQWIREGSLNTGIIFPERLQRFALTHRHDLTIYLSFESTHWQVHWRQGDQTEQSTPLSDPACWHALNLVPYDSIAWDTWRLAAENAWLVPDIDFDIST